MLVKRIFFAASLAWRTRKANSASKGCARSICWTCCSKKNRNSLHQLARFSMLCADAQRKTYNNIANACNELLCIKHNQNTSTFFLHIFRRVRHFKSQNYKDSLFIYYYIIAIIIIIPTKLLRRCRFNERFYPLATFLPINATASIIYTHTHIHCHANIVL